MTTSFSIFISNLVLKSKIMYSFINKDYLKREVEKSFIELNIFKIKHFKSYYYFLLLIYFKTNMKNN